MRTWLCELRKSLGLTLAQMGERLGISEGYYLLIEQGKRQRKMDIVLVAKLSEVSSIPVADIVQRDEEWRKGCGA